jgi:hypothetical protein
VLVLMLDDLMAYYRAKADQAERKAKSAFHPEDAERFQQLAREWRTIAEQAKRMTALLSDADTQHANSQRNK